MVRPLAWPRMWGPPRLKSADFDSQLAADGIETLVRRGVICSCVDRETRSPNENCPVCDAWGFIYDPADDLRIPVLWIGNDPHVKLHERLGTYEPGTYTVTWPSAYPLGYGALFVNPMETNVVPNEFLRRGELDPEGGSLERLRYHRITRVEVVRTMSTVYREGVDWRLNGQFIEWLDGGARPANGEMYGVRYGHMAHFIIDEDVPKLREDGASNRLAYTCRVKKFAAVFKQGGAWLGQG